MNNILAQQNENNINQEIYNTLAYEKTKIKNLLNNIKDIYTIKINTESLNLTKRQRFNLFYKSFKQYEKEMQDLQNIEKKLQNF